MKHRFFMFALLAIILSCPAFAEDKSQQLYDRLQESRGQVKEDQEQKKQKEEKEYWTKLIGPAAIRECKGSFYQMPILMTENPYDVVGKCYFMGTFEASHIQILSHTTALIMYRDNTIYADFGKESAPANGQWRSYVVKGNSKPFKYTAASGIAVTAASVRVLKEITE